MGIHGTLVEVGGQGILLLGPSGVGKSECALELARRGHCFVADDVVELEARPSGLWGRPSPRLGHHLEVRGLGILSMPHLFGAERCRDATEVRLLCRLVERRSPNLDRVGAERPTEALEGVSLTRIELPALPAGTLATLIEVAAKDHALREGGYNAAERFDAELRASFQRD